MRESVRPVKVQTVSDRQNVGHVLNSLDSIADALDVVVGRLDALDFRVEPLKDETLRDAVAATALDIDDLKEEIRRRTDGLRQTRNRIIERQRQIRSRWEERQRHRRRNG